jgi:hypothetical protein
MEHPAVAGDSASVKIRVNPDAKYFQHHSSLIADSERPWVLSSGVDNLTELDINLRVEKPNSLTTGLPVEPTDDDAEASPSPASRYNIRLHFAAPPIDRGGPRVFDVYAQGQLVCSNVTIDPSGTDGKRFLVQFLENVSIANKLRLRFVPKQGQASLAGIEIERKLQ